MRGGPANQLNALAIHVNFHTMSPAQPFSRKNLALLTLIFFASGFASLVYQVVWQRLLTLYYGVSTVSIAIIVSVFLLGLGIGGLAGGLLAERARKGAPTSSSVVELTFARGSTISNYGFSRLRVDP